MLAPSDFSPADQKRVAKPGLPTVLADSVGDLDTDVPSIGAGNRGGGVAATKHLIELGHRRIAVITCPMRLLCSQARPAGYRAALERAGAGSDPELIAHGDFQYASEVASTLELLDRPDPSTAIFAPTTSRPWASTPRSSGAACASRTTSAWVGFDDVPMSQWISPPLTTVRQPIAELAALAVRTVLAQPHRAELRRPASSWPPHSWFARAPHPRPPDTAGSRGAGGGRCR